MMNLFPGKGRIWSAATIFVTALMLFAAACGGDEEPPQCTFGVPEDGRCVNADRCLFQSDCLAGYSCDQGTCTADQECSADTDCDAGVCSSNGVCVNPDSCTSNDECVARTYCAEDGTCAPDPCEAVTCVRGTCEPGSGVCSSKESCTVENQLFDCVQGEKCLEGSCVTSDNYCDQLTCDRGVCDFEAGGCVAADDCAGDDANCLDEQFCNSENSCERNLCEILAIDCGDNGVCQPERGECENAETCESNSDCVEDHLCVAGTCTLESMACGDGPGDGGCFGNQTCEYDEENLEATCAVPDTCVNSLDCLDGQQCGGDACLSAQTCTDDFYEPNNSASEGTDFGAVATQQTVDAELCAGDTDFYIIDTADLDPFDVRGLLTIRLDYADRDIGLGELEVELLEEDSNGDFQSVDSTTTGQFGSDGGATIQLQLDPTSANVFAVRVSGANGVSDAGVTYSLNVDVVDDLAVEACNEARALQDGDILTADNGQATSTILRHSCSAPPADGSERPEQVFQFDVTQPSRVTVSVTPDTDSNDAAVSIRSACTAGGSEVACSNSTDEGIESIDSALLDPGTYYAVVSPTATGSLGQYEIALNISSATCSSSSSFCVDQTTSEYCAGGTGLVSVDCSNGCEPTSGRCVRPDGDLCQSAPTIDSAVTQTITWGEVRNDYSVSSAGCLSANGGTTQSGGADQAFEVVVPDGQALQATLNLGAGEEGSLYVVTDCGDAEGTCELGSNEELGPETLTWPNRTGSEQSVFLIADTSASATFTETQLDIDFLDLVCDPNGATATQCAPGGMMVQDCNATGTAYVDGEDCSPWPCSGGECGIPDTCSDALNITTQARSGTYTNSDTWDRFAADYDADTCGSVTSGDSDGWDAVFQVDLMAGEGLRFTMNTEDSFPEPSVYIVSSCGSTTGGTCLAGTYLDASPTTVEYAATTAETVYVIADTDSESSQSDTWDVTAEIVPTCDPAASTPTCSSGSVKYCRPSGVEGNFACDGGLCTGGQCDNRTADFCFDAENLTAAAAAGGTTINVDWTQYTGQYVANNTCGGVSGSETGGADAYYEIDLLAGEVLVATLDNVFSFDDPALFVASDCLDAANNCLIGDEDSETASVQYSATSAETVYLIADNDDASTTDTFTLDVQVTQPCDPATFPASCARGSDVEFCNSAGGFVDSHTCSSGSCTSAACDSPFNADSCFEPIDLTTAAQASGGTSVTGTWGNFDSNFEGAGGANCSAISSGLSDGHDAVYEVTLAAGETVNATLELINVSGSTWFADPAIAIVPENACGTYGTCYDGDTGSDAPASASYTATSAETVIILADSDDDNSSTQSEEFQLSVDIQ